MEALREATANYMEALVQEALRNGQQETVEDTQDQTELSGQDIEQMLRDVQRLAEQGRHAEAQQMLEQLSQILANMDVRLSESEGGEGEGQQDAQMQESMDSLSQAMGEQRALNNETQQQQQEQQQQQQQDQQNQQSQGGSGGDQQGGQGGDELAQRQAEIRQGLAEAQEMADDAGATPSDSLGEAGEAMRRAEEALRRGDLEGASAAQNAALESMREGAETLAAEMRERGREGQGQRGERSGGARDPLGRSLGGADGEGDAVPSTSDPVRAREIFDEIRRRAQDANRPEAERDYLRRLLDRFGES
jgi:hypothetical protein